MNEMSLYEQDEDGSYYDDDYEDGGGDWDDDYYQAWGWRYELRNRLYRAKWFIWRHFKRCKTCGKRNVNCTCIPF